MAKQVKLKETPKILKKEEFEVVYDNPDAIKDPGPPDNRQPMSANPYLFQVNAIIKDCETWGTIVQITQWANKTGYDITLCGKSGSFQHISITKEEAIIVIDAINQLK
jgi:hypothetical protein